MPENRQKMFTYDSRFCGRCKGNERMSSLQSREIR